MDWLIHLLPHLVNGVSLGLLFALIALGFMLIVGVMETINLAHGSLVRAGDVLRALLRVAAAGLVSRPAGLVHGAADRDALPRRAVPGARVRRPVRHAAGAVHAPHLRARSAVRPAAHVRRRAGDRRDHPPGLGLERAAAGAAAGDLRRVPAGRPHLLEVPLLRQRLRGADDRGAVAVPGEDAVRRHHQGRRARQRDGARARHQPARACGCWCSPSAWRWPRSRAS